MKNKPSLTDIYALFTRNPVLLPLVPGTKEIHDKGWTTTTWENTQNPNYQARLRNTTNVGILLGKNSSNLIFFDWDTQPALDWFLEHNPRFKESFRVTGKGVGGQVGGYAQGDYPANAVFRVPIGHPLAAGAGLPVDKEGKSSGEVQVGSLRGDKLQSVLCGIHPITKGHYSWPVPREPITFNFEAIVWHPDFVLPWAGKHTTSANGEHDENSPLNWATRTVTIDFLWKYFGFKPRSGNPSPSPLRDDNTSGHPSFSIWTDPESGKQVFKDFHDQYAHHRGNSYTFYKLAVPDQEGAFQSFMQIAELILNGETPPPYEPTTHAPELYIPPVRETPKVQPIGEAAYQGFLGEWVRFVEPQTEANRDNLLLQMVTATGIVLGRRFYTYAAADLFPNLFTVILGSTGARKGTALIPVKKFFEEAAPDWHGARDNWKSGEALVHFTRDPVWRSGKLKDEGVSDKRVLVEETELIHLFKTAERQGNTLTDMLRKAWDSPERFCNTSKGSAETATAPHIGTIGHMTNEEFLLVDPGLIDGGLINRITWGTAFRARILSNVMPIEWPPLLLDWFRDIYVYAYKPVELSANELSEIPKPTHVPMDANAQLLWDKVYGLPNHSGTLAKVLERTLSQARKIALIYALCDKSPVITRPHLAAGLAIAEHSKANAIAIFQGFGPNKNANKILSALRINPDGLSLTQIHKHVFNYKASGHEIHEAILELTQNRLISTQGKTPTGPPIWRVV